MASLEVPRPLLGGSVINRVTPVAPPQAVSDPAREGKPRRINRRLAAVAIWARRHRLNSKLAVTVAVLALVSSIATIAALSRKTAPFDIDTRTIRILLLTNIVFLLGLAALIVQRLVHMWGAHRRGLMGSKLYNRIVGYFSIIAVAPPILMALFSAWFLGYGIENWFSEKVRETLNNSLEVAESYIDEHRRVIRADIEAMATDLEQEASVVAEDNRYLQLIVEDQAAKRALSEAIVFDGTGNILAQARLNPDLAPERVPDSVMNRVRGGELVVISETSDDRVRALTRLNGYYDTYLYVSRFVDARVLAHVGAARTSVAEYEEMQGQSSQIELRFNVVFLIVALLVLLAAVWFGLLVAGNMVSPLGRLLDAVGRIGRGDLTARVPMMRSTDEIGTLSRAFNRMARELETQRRTLIDTNLELDERRRFTEAVLSGVSAGVLGLDAAGRVTLPNRSACQLLGMPAEELVGRKIAKAIPKIGPLMKKAARQDEAAASGQLQITKDGQERNLLVRVAAERDGGEITGYVVTFDDVTEQLADQRTAAWADVARRIAHEIKNPLTPIQLSAERLRRKYAKEVESDPAVFDKCTETIIRQVGDLRRMVDEFSSFARMPKPVPRREDIVEIARQALFLQEVVSPNIEFSLDGGASPIPLECDGRLVAQAVANLLKNSVEAIAANRAGGDGRVAIRIVTGPDDVRLIVEDNGGGFPSDLIERLAEPYVTTREKGTGLGLAIVKRIMEDHGGTLTLENRPKDGARATLKFLRTPKLKDGYREPDQATTGDLEQPAETRKDLEKERPHGA